MIYTEPLFLGVTPSGARNYVADNLVSLKKPFFNACAGRFGVVEAAMISCPTTITLTCVDALAERDTTSDQFPSGSSLSVKTNRGGLTLDKTRHASAKVCARTVEKARLSRAAFKSL